MKVADALGNDKLVLSGGFGRFYFRPQKAKIVPGPLWRDLSPSEYFYTKFEQDSWIHTSCWLVSRKLSELAGPWLDLRSPDDDGEYFCRVVAASEGIRFVPQARSYWRVGNYGSFSYSRERSVRSLEAMFESTRRCIGHFRALDDSPRARAACVTFLRNRLIYFYPNHKDLLDRMYQLAAELGGSISTPPLLWQYDLVRACFGWSAARATNRWIPRLQVLAMSTFDRWMHDLSLNRKTRQLHT
jgi:hypothetical protein